MKKLLLVCLSATVLLGACVKKKTDVTGETTIRFVNAIPNSLAQDIYINGNLAIRDLSFPNQTTYGTYTSGLNEVTAINTGTSVANLDYDYGTTIGEYSTVFFFQDFSGNLVSGGIKDDMTAPATGKARVRFVNLNNQSQTSFTADVVGGANLLQSLVFATASPYFDVDPGSKFLIKTLLAKNQVTLDFNPQAGSIYTIWVSANTTADVEAYTFLQK
ncbi:DUF4397 domain-containing protein [Mucilaginibacter sp. dw_454]|uniref:DUF4397 domain-containing protein n=1 Tax=Mucilaginibacter sp. dw_454 TaxID=2720079 RepID=UPI001BD49CB7|nr:DUF4397 domain-containing protein [Mucilaginibacter sp. dw_454]